jgi:hypothetical protein
VNAHLDERGNLLAHWKRRERRWNAVDLTRPPECEDSDPVMLISGHKRGVLAHSPAEAYWMLRTRSYPYGTRVRRIATGELLRVKVRWDL